MWTFKEDARRVIASLVQVEGELAVRYFKRTRQLLWDTNQEDECRVVKAFINGLIDDDHHRALRAARRQNPSMNLVQAYQHLEAMALPENESDGNCNQTAEIEGNTLESARDRPVIYQSRPCRAIAVQDIPGYILVDPMAFGQFLLTNNFRPCYESSGRYAEESIKILHHEFSQLTEEEITDVAPLMKASAEIALVRQNRHKIEISAIKLAPVTKGAILSNYDLSPIFKPKVAAKPVAIETGTKGSVLRAFNPKLEVWGTSLVNESMKSSRNMTGEKEGKWREKSKGMNEGDKGKGVSTRDLGMEMDSFTEALGDTGWTQDVGEAAGQLDAEWANSLEMPVERESWAKEKHETAEEPDAGYQPTSSNDFTGKAIRNPGVKHIRTVSEWDPGPGKSTYTTPAILRNPKGIAVKSISREPAHPVAEFPWLPQLRFQRACHNSRMKSRCNCSGMSAQFLSRFGRALIGGDGRGQVWDPGGKEVKFNSVVQSWRMGRTDWEADRVGSEQRARARGACQEASIWVLRCTVEPRKGCG